MKHKLPKSVRTVARQVANLDGKRRGLNQDQSEIAFHHMVLVRATEIILNRKKSVFGVIEKAAAKKAKAFMKKMKAGK